VFHVKSPNAMADFAR